MVLLPFVRLLIAGPTPDHHFQASTEGTGKSLLAKLCCVPYLGHLPETRPPKDDDAEWRKSITAALMSGAAYVFFDNLRNPQGWDGQLRDIESPSLAAAWTAYPHWTDRVLGSSREVKLRAQATWMSTGNNVSFHRELTRRLVNIELV